MLYTYIISEFTSNAQGYLYCKRYYTIRKIMKSFFLQKFK